MVIDSPCLHKRFASLDIVRARKTLDQVLAALIPAAVGTKQTAFLEDGVRAAFGTAVLGPGTVPVGPLGLAGEQSELSGMGFACLVLQVTSKGRGYGIGW